MQCGSPATVAGHQYRCLWLVKQYYNSHIRIFTIHYAGKENLPEIVRCVFCVQKSEHGRSFSVCPSLIRTTTTKCHSHAVRKYSAYFFICSLLLYCLYFVLFMTLFILLTKITLKLSNLDLHICICVNFRSKEKESKL